MAAPAIPTVNEAVFVAEARDVAGLPLPGDGPEIAIAGRSNVGKSTLLNRLAGRRALARVSRTPGRTRGLVFFDLTLAAGPSRERSRIRLVDLPGYGYARVSQQERRAWQDLVEGYVKARAGNLAIVVVLCDARRGPEAEERQLADWLDGSGVPWVLCFTKLDRLGASERGLLRKRSPRSIAVSGETGEGLDVLWADLLAAVTRLRPA